MPDAPNYPNAVLGHTEMTRRTYNTRTYTTWYTPLQFPRPATGVTEYRVKCAHCGRVVRWRVLSATRASVRRWTWAAILVACIAAVIVAIKIGSYQTGGPYGPQPYAGQAALLAVAAIIVFIVAGVRLIVEHGVRVREWRNHRPARPRAGMKVVRLPAAPPAAPQAGPELASGGTDG